MTLEELDAALMKLNLDTTTKEGEEIRDRILARHGKDILESRQLRCAHCWLKDNKGQCSPSCQVYGMADDPVAAAKTYLSRPNDISIFPYICLYAIPVYEEVSGVRGTMERIAEDFKRMWKKKKKKNCPPSKY